MRSIHIVALVVLIALGARPVCGQSQGSVTGKVCDSAGIPQIGAVVQVLRPDLSVLATVYTDAGGRYQVPPIQPGRYAIKAMGAYFLPALREDVRVRAHTVVNLTLNTLYEVMQWLPAEPRAANARQDDWKWTLRSAANRPLLRWLEDGPLVVVSEGNGSHPKLKARLIATGQVGSFGESGERISAAIEETPADSQALLARVDFAPDTRAGMEAMLGFRQDLGYAGSVQSLAAVAVRPGLSSEGREGVLQAAMSTSETVNLGDLMELEAGSALVAARFSAPGSRTVSALLPYARVAWREGSTTLRYSFATALPGSYGQEEARSSAGLPRLGMRNGRLVIERGTHQELSMERRLAQSAISVAVFSDRIESPVLEAAGGLGGVGGLSDRLSGQTRYSGAEYSSRGVTASVKRNLGKSSQIHLSYANGNALALPVAEVKRTVAAQLAEGARPRRAQVYALALSGTIEGTGTRWRASYRWQPSDTVTRVAQYAEDASPYLNLHLRQPLMARRVREGSRIDALLDVRNLLAEGYRPYLMRDGSVVVFAQGQRGFSAGLAFTF